MELLVTLHKKENFETLRKLDITGVVFGSEFAYGYDLSLDDLVIYSDKCLSFKLKRYISLNTTIQQNDLEKLDAYMDLIKELDFDGIYFSDFAVASKAFEKDLQDKLIYDPNSLVNNIHDIGFMADYNIPCVLARELTKEELEHICKLEPFKVDMQIFGHLRMSESKRYFITNYFRNFNINENPRNKKTYTLKEDNRDYRLPIYEDENGTCVYTDYVFALYGELTFFAKYLKRAIIDDLFLDFDVVVDYIRNIPNLSKETGDVIKESMKNKFPRYDFSTGYLFQKTTDTKVEDE